MVHTRMGLLLCKNIQLSSVEVKLDAKSIIGIFSSTTTINGPYASLLDDCRLLATPYSQAEDDSLL